MSQKVPRGDTETTPAAKAIRSAPNAASVSEDAREPSPLTSGMANPLTIIRTETALSRFPIHRIAKKGMVQIEIKNSTTALLWEVSYNSKYRQPGPLAYKLDTLIINRRIEEVRRPVPTLVRLGSLSQIAGEMGLNRDTNSVRTALLQNAFTSIKAKITYRGADGRDRTLDAAFNRYAVVFTGEQLPGGQSADAVYLVLHPIYAEVLNAAVNRPLDYDYMRSLTAAAQRFYEIVSYKIYGALFHGNERARLHYSEYCLLSTATRYFDFDHVKKQMHKIHKPHITSGYLGGRVTYEATTDDEARPDWWMYYTPGERARQEYREFKGRGHSGASSASRVAPEFPSSIAAARVSAISAPASPGADGRSQLGKVAPLRATITPLTAPSSSPQASPPNSLSESGGHLPAASLRDELIAAGMNPKDARRLAGSDAEECRRQLTYLPHRNPLKNPGGWLRTAIEGRFPPPPSVLSAQERATLDRRRAEESDAQRAIQDGRKAALIAEITAMINAILRSLPAPSVSGEESSDPAVMAMAAFESHFREEKAKRLHSVISPRLRESLEVAYAGNAKRVEVFLTFFSEVYPAQQGAPCPIPEVRAWLENAARSARGWQGWQQLLRQ